MQKIDEQSLEEAWASYQDEVLLPYSIPAYIIPLIEDAFFAGALEVLLLLDLGKATRDELLDEIGIKIHQSRKLMGKG